MLQGKAFGEAGTRVVIEDYLDGEELTIMAFTDGKTVIPMIPAQDHKQLEDGDRGPNTGGMGAYAPAPIGTPAVVDRVRRTILEPIVGGLSQMGRPFHGVIYAGLMMVNDDPKVLEFNARMGDPETQAVLPLLKTDLLEVLLGVVEHRLDQVSVEWHSGVAVCVVLAAEGYPSAPVKGRIIRGLDGWDDSPSLILFHAGTGKTPSGTATAGGRVLDITGVGKDFHAARERAYDGVRRITFEGMQYRRDIGSRALLGR